MIKKEELLNKEELKELSEDQIEAILGIAQEKGDATKKKYQAKEEELNKIIEEAKNKKEPSKDTGVSNPDNKDDDREDKLLGLINELNEKINGMERDVKVKSKKEKLLEEAKKNGYDLKQADQLFSKFGENLSEDFSEYEGFLTKLENGSSNDPEPDPEGGVKDPKDDDDDDDPGFMNVSDPLISSILNDEK